MYPYNGRELDEAFANLLNDHGLFRKILVMMKYLVFRKINFLTD